MINLSSLYCCQVSDKYALDCGQHSSFMIDIVALAHPTPVKSSIWWNIPTKPLTGCKSFPQPVYCRASLWARESWDWLTENKTIMIGWLTHWTTILQWVCVLPAGGLWLGISSSCAVWSFVLLGEDNEAFASNVCQCSPESRRNYTQLTPTNEWWHDSNWETISVFSFFLIEPIRDLNSLACGTRIPLTIPVFRSLTSPSSTVDAAWDWTYANYAANWF